MEQVGFQLLSELFSDKVPGPCNSPADRSSQLFRGILDKSIQLGKTSRSRDRGGFNEHECTAGILDSALRQVGIPMGRLKLPRSAIPELVSFLDRQGLQSDEIRALISSISDKDGSIPMDRLLVRLQQTGRSGKKLGDPVVLEAKDIPAVGESLASIGIGPGKIREVIETSLTRKGALSIEMLSGSLGVAIPGYDWKTVVQSMLERSQLKGSVGSEGLVISDGDVKNLVDDLARGSSPDAQKRIKEEIAGILREKGVPPQEIKTFLETLTATHAGVLSKRAGADPAGAGKSESDAGELTGKIVYGAEAKPRSDEWRDRILDILHKGQGGKEGTGKEWFRQWPVEMAVPRDSPQTGEGKPRQSAEAETARRRANTNDPHAATVKNSITTDLSAVRLQKENLEVPGVVRQRDAALPPEPIPKILDRIFWMIQGGEQKGRIQISPPELGRLDIDLAIRNGHLHAQLRAENPLVKELLDANLAQLRQNLNDLGFVVDRFEVMVGLDQENHFSREQGWTAAHRRGNPSSRGTRDDALTTTGTEGAAAAHKLSRSQVDMLV